MGATGSPGLSVAAVYITLDDNVSLIAWNSNPALTTLQLQLRILKPDGSIVITSQTLQGITADKLPAVVTLGQLEGFILGAAIAPPAVTLVTGECWIKVSVIRGAPGNPLMVMPLVADYVSSGNHPGWPSNALGRAVDGAGKVKAVQGNVPLVGTDASITVPTNTRWQVLAVSAALTTSALAGNRQVTLTGFPNGLSAWTVPAPAAQPPSTQFFYTFAPGLPALSNVASQQAAPLPSPTFLEAGDVMTTETIAFRPSDQWTPLTVAVVEWIDV
jgi:hypothetical protein